MVEINFWAVLVCGAASMVLGFLWYGPLFGKSWAKEMGWGNITPEQEAEKKKQAGKAYPQVFIGALLMAYVLAVTLLTFMKGAGQEPSVSMGLQGAFWLWLGFIVPVKYGDKLWGGKSLKLFFIDVVYYLVQLAVFALILISWR
jgi:hypothetical protein